MQLVALHTRIRARKHVFCIMHTLSRVGINIFIYTQKHRHLHKIEAQKQSHGKSAVYPPDAQLTTLRYINNNEFTGNVPFFGNLTDIEQLYVHVIHGMNFYVSVILRLFLCAGKQYTWYERELHPFLRLTANSECRSLAHNKFSGSLVPLEHLGGEWKALYVRVGYPTWMWIRGSMYEYVFWHNVELSECWFSLISMLGCVRAHRQLGLGLELEVGLLDLR